MQYVKKLNEQGDYVNTEEEIPQWEGDFCERASGKVLLEKQKTKHAIIMALSSVNFSDPNASSVAEGGGKALSQVTDGTLNIQIVENYTSCNYRQNNFSSFIPLLLSSL